VKVRILHRGGLTAERVRQPVFEGPCRVSVTLGKPHRWLSGAGSTRSWFPADRDDDSIERGQIMTKDRINRGSRPDPD
jgi:hypothetical protein